VKVIALIALLSVLADPALAHHAIGGNTPLTFTQGLLSGLGHPIIGLDHLAAVLAVGCLAASQRRGALLVIGYVASMMIGAAAHIGEATVAGAEIFVALSMVALGAVLILTRPVRIDVAVALFAFAGLVHGYALGESIAGAEAAPRYGYFIGLAMIQSAVALAVMAAVRGLATYASKPAVVRLLGAGVVCLGLILLVQQIVSAA
jgi:urease accessory protein